MTTSHLTILPDSILCQTCRRSAPLETAGQPLAVIRAAMRLFARRHQHRKPRPKAAKAVDVVAQLAPLGPVCPACSSPLAQVVVHSGVCRGESGCPCQGRDFVCTSQACHPAPSGGARWWRSTFVWDEDRMQEARRRGRQRSHKPRKGAKA